MSYYEKIFEDLGIDTTAPGNAVMSTLVNNIYTEMNNVKVECNKDFSAAWNMVEHSMVPTIRYIRLMSYYKYMGILLGANELCGAIAFMLRTCAQLKSANVNTNYWDSPLDNAAVNFIQGHYAKLYENARASLTSTNGAAESVVTDCSPITPYVGVVKAPFAGIIDELKEDEKEDALESDAHPIFNDGRVKEKALQKFILIFNDPERFAAILNFEDEIKSMYLNHGKYFIREMHHVYPIAVTEFITYSNLIANPDLFPKAVKFMLIDQDYQHALTADDNIAQNHMVPLAKAMEAYSELLDEAGYTTEEELTADTNRILAQSKHFLDSVTKAADAPHDRDVLTDTVIVPNDKLHTFNLNHLMNFIYTSRRYISDQYAIMSFMDGMAVKSVSYINDFILIEPDMGAKTSEYIYVPVTDTLNGRRACIIRFHRESGEIDVLTTQQYNDSVQQVTGPEPPTEVPQVESEDATQYADPASGT